MDKKEDKLGDTLVRLTQKYLTHLKRKRYVDHIKAKRRGLVLDFLMAFIWAVCWVFVINQYLVQAYRIPSGSMEPTLLVGDHLFVNKVVFGPEILPGVGKLPSPFKPSRGNIVILQSPEYQPKGATFEIIYRLLYTSSFGLINLNKNTVDLLIKRIMGDEGDQIIMRDGDFYIKATGEKNFIREADFLAVSGLTNHTYRLLQEEDYYNSRLLAITEAYRSQNIPLPSSLKELEETDLVVKSRNFDAIRVQLNAEEYQQAKMFYRFYPWIKPYKAAFFHTEQGIYVPKGYLLPLGDNRDNSHDGRAWGVVSKDKILGTPLWRFFPLNRFGGTK